MQVSSHSLTSFSVAVSLLAYNTREETIPTDKVYGGVLVGKKFTGVEMSIEKLSLVEQRAKESEDDSALPFYLTREGKTTSCPKCGRSLSNKGVLNPVCPICKVIKCAKCGSVSKVSDKQKAQYVCPKCGFTMLATVISKKVADGKNKQ